MLLLCIPTRRNAKCRPTHTRSVLPGSLTECHVCDSSMLDSPRLRWSRTPTPAISDSGRDLRMGSRLLVVLLFESCRDHLRRFSPVEVGPQELLSLPATRGKHALASSAPSTVAFAPAAPRVPPDVSPRYRRGPNRRHRNDTPPHWTRLTPCASAGHHLIGCARCTACLTCCHTHPHGHMVYGDRSNRGPSRRRNVTQAHASRIAPLTAVCYASPRSPRSQQSSCCHHASPSVRARHCRSARVSRHMDTAAQNSASWHAASLDGAFLHSPSALETNDRVTACRRPAPQRPG